MRQCSATMSWLHLVMYSCKRSCSLPARSAAEDLGCSKGAVGGKRLHGRGEHFCLQFAGCMQACLCAGPVLKAVQGRRHQEALSVFMLPVHLNSRCMTELSKRTGAGLGLISAGSSMIASCIAQHSINISGWCSCTALCIPEHAQQVTAKSCINQPQKAHYY